MEEVHGVGIGDGIVIGRVRDDNVPRATTTYRNCGCSETRRSGGTSQSLSSVASNPTYPIQATLIASCCFTENIRFAEIPYYRQCVACKSMGQQFLAVMPHTQST
ncbi:MAG: hypothetical protein DDT29_02336 [Dehalococcoidia bacterium]|nr:hypothetical protein [Bacillota bacterium]